MVCAFRPPYQSQDTFLEGPENFSGPQSRNKNVKPLQFTEMFLSHNFHTKLIFMDSLMPIRCFLFEIPVIKNGFTGPISYRVFRETCPRPIKKFICFANKRFYAFSCLFYFTWSVEIVLACIDSCNLGQPKGDWVRHFPCVWVGFL